MVMKAPIAALCMIQAAHCFVVGRTLSAVIGVRRCSRANVTMLGEQSLDEFRQRQAAVARPNLAEKVKTLIEHNRGYGVLSTNSVQYGGYPTGSVVGFHTCQDGLPYFSFSGMSAHSKDLKRDKRVSLTVLHDNFKGAADSRAVLIGDTVPVTDPTMVAELKAKYQQRHRDAYWVEFGDFGWFLMEKIVGIRYVGGFASAGSVSPEEYLQAQPDPLVAFAAPVLQHMNADHAESVAAMVAQFAGFPCSKAVMVAVDRLGFEAMAELQMPGLALEESITVRVPFPNEVTERKQLKQVLVAMAQAAASRTGQP